MVSMQRKEKRQNMCEQSVSHYDQYSLFLKLQIAYLLICGLPVRQIINKDLKNTDRKYRSSSSDNRNLERENEQIYAYL